MNPTFSVLRSLPPRSHLPSAACRARRPLPTANPRARNFSAATATATDPIQPLQQGSEANVPPTNALQDPKPDAADVVSKRQPIPTTKPSPSNLNTPITKPIPEPKPPTSRFRDHPTSDARAAVEVARRMTGTVVRTHTMAKTVAVATNRQHFDRFLQKHYTRAAKTLVHDPEEILIEGDVIQYGVFPPLERAERMKIGKGKRVKYVLKDVVTPFGVPLEQRRLPEGLGKSA